MGWAQNLLIEEHDYLPKHRTVFRKTNSEPYISRQKLTDLEESLSFKPSGKRSDIRRFSLAKFSKFFCGASYTKIFWEIIC